jgi:hypothetical protein
VAGGETIEDVVIRLDGGARLTGRVLDSQGNGVSAAKLFIGEVPNGDWMMDREKRAVSGPDGTYEMVSLPAGSVRVSVFHSRFAPRSVDLNVTPAITNRADIVMSNGGMVTGVLTLDGSPMPQQSVHVSAPNGTPQSANTDESGRYEIGGLPDGRIHINPTLQAPGVPFRGKTAYAEVTDGVVIEMDFDFVTGTSSVEGIVYDASDRPVGPLMRVSLHVETGDGVTDYMYSQTDPSGYYQFESVPAGQARLRAWRDSGAQTEAIVAIGERDRIRQDLRLE